MTQRLESVVQELRAEEGRIQRDVDSLRDQMKMAEARLKQVRGALLSLKEKPQPKSANRRPAATTDDVTQAIITVLSSVGPLNESDLRRSVEQKLKLLGKSRTGFALRFKQALNDDRFVRDGSRLALARQRPTSLAEKGGSDAQ